MKNIMNAPFVEEMRKTTANMYRLGWDERNGGNISYLLNAEEVYEYLDKNNVIRTIPLGFDAASIIGCVFIVTGTGKYFKNVNDDPETNLGIVRIAADGKTAELLWGYKDDAQIGFGVGIHILEILAGAGDDKDLTDDGSGIKAQRNGADHVIQIQIFSNFLGIQ